MKNIFKKVNTIIQEITPVAFTFLCLGIVIQLIIGEPILGWDVVGNISKAIGKLGQNTFVGIAALLFLYTIINNRKEK
tara:strand:+ start:34 stop:267 length:234 start_codon:yes stop_codon:yes gene_type:complete